MERVADAYHSMLATLVAQLVEQAIAERIEPYVSFPRERLAQVMTTAMGAFDEDLRADTTQHFAGYFQQVAATRAQEGTQLNAMLRVILLSQQIADDLMLGRLDDDQAALTGWVRRSREIYASAVLQLSQVYSAAHEQVIHAQMERIRELSTPIIPLHSGLLLLPLVGALDSRRAQQITEELLEAISREQAEVVIIDITGVPVVDTQVGHYLIQAARAAQLLGAQVILVGISAEIAQTMVHIGMTLSGLVTKANLQAGLEYAFRLRGMSITGAQNSV